ncbi:phosphatase [Pantoea phage Nafs113]|nr:phosphatase [Pantoea phage Nafs113]
MIAPNSRQPLPVILVDLDGTMFDNTHRAHLVPPRDKWRDASAWAEYELAAMADKPVETVVEMVKTLHSSGRYNIAYCTARFASRSQLTVQQLSAHGLNFQTGHLLVMRPDDSQMKPGEFKSHAVKNLAAMGLNVIMAIDDSDEVIASLEAIGVTTLQPKSRCAAVQMENADTSHALKEEKEAHRQTKEKLGKALARNSVQAAELDRVKHELDALRTGNIDHPSDAYFMLREVLELSPVASLVDTVTSMAETHYKLMAAAPDWHQRVSLGDHKWTTDLFEILNLNEE